jgi:PAS domain S-box-containing protein
MVGGFVLVVLAASFTFWIENLDQQRQAYLVADAQLDKMADRLTNARGEIDSASVFVERAPSALQKFDEFVSRLALSRAKSSKWMLIAAVDPSKSAEALEWARQGLDDPLFEFQADPKSAGPNLYVLRTAGTWDTSVIGHDFSTTPEIYQELVTDQVTSDRPGSMEAGAFIAKSGLLPSNLLWVYQKVIADDKAGPITPPLYVVRAFNIEKLKSDSNVDPSQQFNFTLKVGDRVKSLVGLTQGSASLEAGISRTVVAEPFTFDLYLTNPPSHNYPRFWILWFLIGLTGTGLAFAWKAGQRAIANAADLTSTLRETRTILDDTRDREATFFENTGTANCETDAKTGRLIRVNRAMCELFGYSAEELVGKSVQEITHPEDQKMTQAVAQDMKQNLTQPQQFEKRYQKADGSVFWALVQAKYYVGAYKDRARFMTTIIDISERKAMEATKNNLVRELAHRVRNTVQLTASMARQTAKTVKNVNEYDSKFRQRLGALSAAQDVLFDASWDGADLIFLAKRTLEPFAGARLRVKLVSLHLPTQHAQTLAIALHELASNSIAFGSLSHGGSVDFSGEIIPATDTEEKQIHLIWLETGFTPKMRSRRQGFGHKMLFSALPGQFGGRAEESRTANSYTYECWLTLTPTH